jgi:hypothetical protein
MKIQRWWGDMIGIFFLKKSHNHGEVGFLSFVHNPTPILPKTAAVEVMFCYFEGRIPKKIPW